MVNANYLGVPPLSDGLEDMHITGTDYAKSMPYIKGFKGFGDYIRDFHGICHIDPCFSRFMNSVVFSPI